MNCKLAPLVVGIIRSHLLIRDSGADAFAFIESTSSEGSDHLSRLVQPIIFNVNAYFDVGQLDFRWILLTKPTGTSHGHSLVRKNYRWTRSMSFVSYTFTVFFCKNFLNIYIVLYIYKLHFICWWCCVSIVYTYSFTMDNCPYLSYIWHNEVKRGKKSILAGQCKVCLKD